MKIILRLLVFSTSGYWRHLAAYKSLCGTKDWQKCTVININRTLHFKGA